MKVAVLDVGKTNVKAVVVDLDAGREIAARTRSNKVVNDGPYPHFDVDSIFAFFIQSLRDLNAELGFEAISITAHGASGVLLGDQGLALPVLDYEFLYPREINEAYDAIRPPFAETFSPRLPGGLNFGAQLHYQKTAFPDAFEQVRAIVTYPQYWAWRLTGVATTEVTSLGCHTDLWRPRGGRFSDLVSRLGIADKMAPVRKPSDCLGHVKPDVAEQVGLDRPIPVACGIHDSNASLLPHLVQREAPFAVVSTGTWVVLFAVGGDLDHLDPTRDTLANADAYGRAVPSARFMGGREFELLTGGQGAATPDAVQRVLRERILFMPGIVPGCGPFPDARHRRLDAPSPLDADATYVAASLYAALMTDVCLGLTGASGPIVVEGPFARNRLYLEALAKVRGQPVVAVANSTGTCLGAAMLVGSHPVRKAAEEIYLPDAGLLPTEFESYCSQWRAAVEV